MPKKSDNFIGTLPSPFGTARVRIQIHQNTNRPFFVCVGATDALRWLFPGRSVAAKATKISLTPPDEARTEADLRRLFALMLATATGRLQPEPRQSAGMAQPVLSTETLGDMLKLLEAEVVSSLRPSTVVTYRHEWKAVFAYLPESTPLRSVTREVVQDFVGRKVKDGVAPATIIKHATQLRRLMQRACDEDLIPGNPCLKVRLPRALKPEPKFLKEPERTALILAARANGRDAYLMVCLGIYLGLRKAELLAMRWTDLDLNERVAHVRNTKDFTTKNGKQRTIPICTELCDIIPSFAQPTGFVLRPDKPYRSGSRYRWDFRGCLESCAVAAGLPEGTVTPHVLRHTFASMYARKGVSLYKIGTWMGHSQTEVTELYAHLEAFDPAIDTPSPEPRPKVNPEPRPSGWQLRIVK